MALVENNGKRKGNGLTSFNQKAVKETVVNGDLDVNVGPGTARQGNGKRREWQKIRGNLLPVVGEKKGEEREYKLKESSGRINQKLVGGS